MNRLKPDADDARFIRRVLLLVLIAAVLFAIYRAGNLIILAFGSMLGAIAIHALADIYRNRLRLPPRIAIGLSMASLLAVLGFLIWLFVAQFGDQVDALITRLPVILQQFSAHLSQSPVGAKVVDAVQAAYAGSKVAQDIGGLAQGGVELLLNFILLVIGALFFAVQPEMYERGFLLLIPRDKRPVFADAFADLGQTLRLWLRAEIILMTTMGVLVGLGLWVSGVPSSAALGLLAGLSEFIPYVGPTAAMLPALGIAATKGTGPFVGTLVTYAVVRLIQTNFLTPYVQKKVINIPPAMTLFAIISIGFIFGLFGLFFSAAILVLIFSLVKSLYLRETLGEDIGGRCRNDPQNP
jgi:predicted PurR-regulated permease PerM